MPLRRIMQRQTLFGVFENPHCDELTLVLDLKKSNVVVLEGEKSRRFSAGK